MSDTLRPYPPNAYCWLSKGKNTALRSSSVYQISKYPSSEKRIVKAFRSQSVGANASNAFGKEILHPGPGGAIVVGTSLATIAARRGSSARVGSHGTDWPSMIIERTGSSCGWFRTCSSDSRRYLPGAMRRIQASRVSAPRIHGIRSEKYFGKAMRFDASAVACAGMSWSGGMRVLGFYPILPKQLTVKSFSVIKWVIFLLTFTQFYRNLQFVGHCLRGTPYLVWCMQPL